MQPTLLRERYTILYIAFLFLFIFSCLYYFNAGFNHFYYFGGQYDPVIFAGIIERGSSLLHVPHLARDDLFSFYNTHFSPFLYLPQWLFPLTQLDSVIFFSGFLAFAHQICAVILVYCLYNTLIIKGFEKKRALIFAIATYFLFSFNMMQLIHFNLPHVEILLSGFIILCGYAYATQNYALLLAGLILGFSVREDAGAHIGLLLFCIKLMQVSYTRKWDIKKTDLYFIFFPVLLSIALVVIIEKYSTHKLLTNGFVGANSFSHVTYEIIIHRIKDVYLNRLHISAPLTLLLFLSIFKPFRFLIFSILYALPWILFNIVFCNYTCGFLLYYFNFPLMAVFAFPLYAYLIDNNANYKNYIVAFFLGLIFCTSPVLNMIGQKYHQTLFFSGKPQVSDRTYYTISNFLTFLKNQNISHRHLFGNIEFLALAPNDFKRPQILPSHFKSLNDAEPKVFIFFNHVYGCKTANKEISRHLPMHAIYKLEYTSIFLLFKTDEFPALQSYPTLKKLETDLIDLCTYVKPL